ncbi:MAG: 16S rRNA (adenine(1518)-N(6)/adenine(1519)-N(6))-dimethyltransferase RsmA [Anaerolineales bacterium]
MSNLPPLSISRLLREHNIRPNRRLGQNFLIAPQSLQKVIQAAQISAGDIVLEIGAGVGSLTRELAAICQQVIAIEIDQKLIPILNQVIEGFPNVQIIQGDILQIDLATLPSLREFPYQVVANIPYYITSAVIRHLLESHHRPQKLTLTLQKEVAQRICAPAGDLSLLGLSVQLYGKPTIVATIPANAFYPVPKVESAVIRVDLSSEPRIPDTELFFRLAKAAFSQKRKTLRNAMMGGLNLPSQEIVNLLVHAQIDANRRAETLTWDEWSRLVQAWLDLNY